MNPSEAVERARLAPTTLLFALPLAAVLGLPLLQASDRGGALASLPIVLALAIAAVSDLRVKLVPDVITLPAIAWALLTAALAGRLPAALIGLLAAGGLVLVAAVVTRGGVGGGDVKLAALLGVALGWQPALAALAVSQLVGGVIAVGLLLARRGSRHTTLPIGAVIAIVGALLLVATP